MRKDTKVLKPPTGKPVTKRSINNPNAGMNSGTDLTGDNLLELSRELNDAPKILLPEESEDFLRCALYVRLHELQESYTKQKLADEIFKVNYKTLVAWIVRWQASGMIQRVRSMIFTALVSDDILAAGDMVARNWGAIVARNVNTAKNSKSDMMALEAAKWLHEVFIKPRMDAEENDINQELAYIMGLKESSFATNPMAFLESGQGEEPIEDIDEAAIEEFEFDIPDTEFTRKAKP